MEVGRTPAYNNNSIISSNITDLAERWILEATLMGKYYLSKDCPSRPLDIFSGWGCEELFSTVVLHVSMHCMDTNFHYCWEFVCSVCHNQRVLNQR